jgi:hypothetical protein
MIKMDCYIEGINYTLADHNTNTRFVHIDDTENLKTYVLQNRKFTPEYFNMIITMKINDKQIIGLDGPSGLNIWLDYLDLMEEFLKHKTVRKMYGIEPVQIEFRAIDDNLLFFSIYDEFDPDDVFVKTEVPTKYFLPFLLEEIESFLVKLTYQGDYDNSIYKDYFQYGLNKIKVLRDAVGKI